MLSKLKKRWFITVPLIVLILLFGRPIVFLSYHYWKDKTTDEKVVVGYTNDASKMNATKIDSLIHIDSSISIAELQLTRIIQMAGQQGKKISIAGSQHSMGGHTIYPGGIVLQLSAFNQMQLDTATNILTVGAGAKWSEVVPYLDRFQRSVAIMQTNNSFSVGGSISVNCHGWKVNSPPIASTVESFRLLMADAVIRNCSRTENAELFSLALGGYGLFGVILEVKLRVIPNAAYRMRQFIIPAKDYINAFRDYVDNDPSVGMAYGRLNIDPENFLNEAILSICRNDSLTAIPELKEAGYAGLRRTIFRASSNSNYGKKLRWRAETLAARLGKNKLFSRNQLINEPVTVFENTRTGYADILQEYFIPRDSVNTFIKKLKTIIPSYDVDLMNITIRNVRKDEDVFLNYARDEVFGFVMLFNQSTTKEAEDEMKILTQVLIETAYTLKGTYYLPYRLHGTMAQFNKTYPMASTFFSYKVKYDPMKIFQNEFYLKYGE